MEDKVIKGKDILAHRGDPEKNYTLKVYDFTKPDKFSFDQIRTLSLLHEGFARSLTTVLSSGLRLPSSVNVELVDQLTYGEFLDRVPSPGCLGVFTLPPLLGQGLIEFENTLAHSVTDRLLGGTGKGAEASLSELEKIITGETFKRFVFPCFTEAWSPVLGMVPGLLKMETKPSLVWIVPPRDMVILVSFSVKLGDLQGRMNLVLPFLTIEPLIPKLAVKYWFSSPLPAKDQVLPLSLVSSMEVDCRLFCRGENISLKKSGELKEGDLIKLSGLEKDGLFLEAGKETLVPLRISSREEGHFSFESIPLPVQSVPPGIAALFSLPGESTSDMQKMTSSFSSILSGGLKRLEDKLDKVVREMEQAGGALLYNLEEVPSPGRGAFDFITEDMLENLHLVLEKEPPSLAALIISRISDGLGALLLDCFDPATQIAVIRFLSELAPVAPPVIDEVECFVKNKLEAMASPDGGPVGGFDKVAAVLNLAPRSVEKHVITFLEEKDPSFAEEIKQRMFVFEDIVLLPPRMIKTVFEKTERQTWLKALKPMGDNVRKPVFNALGPEESAKLEKEIADISHLRYVEADAAGQEIVYAIRRMDEAGEIVVPRFDELIKE